MRKTCLILNNREPIPEDSLDSLISVLDTRWYQRPEETFSLMEALKDNADANILITTYMDLSAAHLSLLKHLEAIITTTTATEYVDRAFCDAHNIALLNTANYTGSSVAEFAYASGEPLWRMSLGRSDSGMDGNWATGLPGPIGGAAVH
jgi:lactate dehydrogenase-like 2-hydroxyacid dehydrogenase